MMSDKVHKRFFEMCVLLSQLNILFEQKYILKKVKPSNDTKSLLKFTPVFLRTLIPHLNDFTIEESNVFNIFKRKLSIMSAVAEQFRLEIRKQYFLELPKSHDLWRYILMILVEDFLPFSKDANNFDFKDKYFKIGEKERKGGLMDEYCRLECLCRYAAIRNVYQARCSENQKILGPLIKGILERRKMPKTDGVPSDCGIR